MKTLLYTLFIFLGLHSFNLWASTEDGGEDWVSYESIVNELSNSTKTNKPGAITSEDPFDDILLHTSIGLASSYVFLSPSGGPRLYGFLKGFEANFGIDLFSRNWMAEGSARSYGSEELKKGHEVSLKEFDLKLVYLEHISSKTWFRLGGGVAARYLDYHQFEDGKESDSSFSTPSSVLFVGLRANITPLISLGSDLSYRSSLIEDTMDKSSLDASLRLGAHF